MALTVREANLVLHPHLPNGLDFYERAEGRRAGIDKWSKSAARPTAKIGGNPAGPTTIKSGARPFQTMPTIEAVQAFSESGAGVSDSLPLPAQAPAPPIYALSIAGSQTGRVVSSLAAMLGTQRKLYCLDGGNTFNPYRLASLMRRQGRDPAELLRRIFVSRAYTCHQLLGAAQTMLTPLAHAEPQPLVAVLGIDRLFHDEDLPLWERRHLFARLLERIADLRGQGMPTLITFGTERPNPWARNIERIARVLPGAAQALEQIEEQFFLPANEIERSRGSIIL